MRLDAHSLVVLVGASASGKSSWAAAQFRPEQVVSSDALRAVVGETARDQRASKDAFDLLERIVALRVKQRLLTVVDTTGLDEDRRTGWLEAARKAGVPAIAVVFPATQKALKERNRRRDDPVPDRVVVSQARQVKGVEAVLADEGWDVRVVATGEHPEAGVAHGDAAPTVALVPPAFVAADEAARRQTEDPTRLSFGLSLPTFGWDGDATAVRYHLTEVARAAEGAGFTTLHVMDHLVQIPSFGPVWEPMLESISTLNFLAGVTQTIRLGALVHGVTYRNIGLLGKSIATLDVVSGGRAICGIGAAWFEREHDLYGYDFPPLGDRYAALEDALEFLPLLWGTGTKGFEGRTFSTPEAVCYPRPIQDPHPPLWVGGGGEKRTLRLVAQHAQACNLFGDAGTVRHKVEVLHGHCADVGRDPAEVLVTHLGSVVCGRDRGEVATQVEALRPPNRSPETAGEHLNAGTVEDHIGRFRELSEAGVQHAILDLPPVATVANIERFTEVIAAFPRSGG